MEFEIRKNIRWFYFDGEKFRNLKDIADKGEEDNYTVDDEKILEKVLFETYTTEQGQKGDGTLYLGPHEKGLRLGSPPDFLKFMNLFCPHILSDDHHNKVRELLKRRDIIKRLISSRAEIESLPETLSYIFKEPTDYLAKLLNFSEKGRSRSITGIEKLLHQVFVLFKIPDILYGSKILNESISLKRDMRSVEALSEN